MSEKICPDCEQRRPHHEIFCQTVREAGCLCGWNLTDVPIDVPNPVPPCPAAEDGPACVNGHPLNAGDYICRICGANPRAPAESGAPEALGEGPQEPYQVPEVSIIGGWEVLSRLSSSGTTDCFRVRGAGEALGILTLYPDGLRRDPAVDAAVDALAPSVASRVLGRGEQDDRRFEVVESADGRTLDDVAVAAEDSEGLRRIVRALGAAIHAVSWAGLRHRDLRPQAILPGVEPDTFTMSRFGFARLSSHDLDTAPPAELSRYTAPEMLAGAVSPASDWWSLGVILLEKLTHGVCFEGISDQAFLMNVVANGAEIPAGLSEEARLLLRGLLARDRTARWAWDDVDAWARGEPRPAPDEGKHADDAEAGSIELGGRALRAPSKYALAAGRAENWAAARDQLVRGVVVTWLEEFPTADRMRSAIRNLMRREGIDNDTRLSVGLKVLNPEMPLVRAGEIVTPGWLLQHPVEGYELISGPAPGLLDQLGLEPWLMQLQKRDADVRRRAATFDIELNEDILRVNLLCTSRRRLDELWEEQRRQAPDSDHRGLASLMDRPHLAEEDVLILVSAGRGQFRPLQEVLREASELARREGVAGFDEAVAAALLQKTRREIMQRVADRVENFARCGLQRIDEWVDQFRLERRTALARAAVILSVPPESWKRPPGQEYVSQLLGFFEKRINVSVSRGALARMTITRTSPRLDLTELGTQRETADCLLNGLLERTDIAVNLDPAIFASNPDLEHRLRTLVSRAELLRRETGIDGLYMGFPFLLAQPRGATAKPRIAPVLLWPIRIGSEVGQRGRFSLGFDRDREEVRVNPALQNLFSRDELAKWESTRDNILTGATNALAAMDELGHLAGKIRQGTLARLPGPDAKVAAGSIELTSAAVLFHVTFVGQAIVEDIRQLRSIPPAGTNLESLLRVQDTARAAGPPPIPGDDIDRYATAESDPTQDRAVVMARNGAGLVIEGPPGTGKSQTIVNMVADAIGRKKSILIICQKQAALDVVCKRLHREGLGDRLVMVTDLSKDRRPVIQAVREQVEATLANGAPDTSWQRQRKAVVDRIRRLEDRLNAHQEALHIRDELSGRTYRELVSELVALEDAGTIGDCLELRDRLGAMEAEQAGEVTETCASLSRLWLPAEYEGSALAKLKAFGSDQATLNRFHKDLEGFCGAERRRPAIASRTPGMSEFENPEPARRWVEESRDRLCGLNESERKELAYFIDLFVPPKPGTTLGSGFIRRLSGLRDELASLASQPDQKDLDKIIAQQSDPELARWISVARGATRPASVLGRLSLPRYLKRRRLRGLLQATCSNADDQVLSWFMLRAQLQARLRAIRADIQAIYSALRFAQVDLSRAAAGDLVAHADWLVVTLKRVEDLAALIVSSPAAARALAAAKSREAGTFDQYFADVDATIARSDARSDSRRALAVLERWFEPTWVKACESHIAKNHATGPVVGPIVTALGTLPAYQQYRVRATSLPPDTLAVLAALRQLAPQLGQIGPDMMTYTVRNSLRREACLGWKARLESVTQLLLLGHQEIEELVRSLAEAEAELRQVNKRAITANIDPRRLGTRDKWRTLRASPAPARGDFGSLWTWAGTSA
jgi:primosomal replication protein N''